MTKIVNSSAGNSIFDINGNAINNSAYKPNINGGASAGLGSNRLHLNNASTELVEGTGTTVSSNDKIVQVDLQEVFKNTRDTNKRETVKTVKTATAIRNNKLHDGDFDTNYPETSNDTTAIGIANDNVLNKTNRKIISDGVKPDTNV